MGQQVTKGEGGTQGQSAAEGNVVLERMDLSNKDLSVTGAAEMAQIGEKYADSMKTLILQNCQLAFLENIVYFMNLEHLDLSRNLITDLENSKNEVLFFVKALTNLNLSYNYLTSMPSLLFNLARLSTLNLSNNNIAIICDEIGELSNLNDLDLSFNQLAFLPDTLIKLTLLNKLKLNSNELKELPGLAPSVSFLNLNDNLLKALPPSIGILTNLKKLYVDNNELLEVPPELGRLVSLRELNLNFNQLIDLPSSLGSLTDLSLLDISDNLFEAKDWFDPDVPNLLKFIRTKTIKPSRNGKFKSKKRRQDTLRIHPTQRKGSTPARPKISTNDSAASPSTSSNSLSPSASANNLTGKDSKSNKRKSIPSDLLRPVATVFLKLFRFKNIDDVSIGDTPSIVMADRVVCDYHSLDAADVYMLDTGETIFIWVGPRSHPNELMKAQYMAQKVNAEFGANVPIVVLSHKSMYDWEVASKFWSNLGVLNEADVKPLVKLLKDPKSLAKAKQGGGSKLTDSSKKNPQSEILLFGMVPPTGDKEALNFRVDEARIYKVVENDEDRVNIYIVSVAEPPVKSILDSSACLVFDLKHNPSVYVWAGTYASSESKSWALLKAEEIINRDVNDSSYERALAWNLDDAETWDFKELFFDWLDVEWDPAERERIRKMNEQQTELLRLMEQESLTALKSVNQFLSPSPSGEDISIKKPSESSEAERKAQEAARAEAERLELERLEKELVEKRRKQGQAVAEKAAEEARNEAEKRRTAARLEAEVAEAKRSAEREKAAAEAKAAQAKAADKAKQAAKDAEKLEKEKAAAFAAAASLMTAPPASRPTPANLLKNVKATIQADVKQAEKINAIWKPPVLDKSKLADLPESRGSLLAGPRRAIGPQGRRAATGNPSAAAKNIETKESAEKPRIAVGGGFGLLRNVGGEAALLQRKEKTDTASSQDAQVAQKGNQRLIWIKGRRKILIRQCPVKSSSLNSGDVFILDNGKGILYQWNGKDANRIEKGKAMDLAKNIKDKEYSGTAKVVVLEEGKTDTNLNDAFWKSMFEASTVAASYDDLKIQTAEQGGDDAEAEQLLKTSCDIYKLVPGKKEGRLEPELIASYPLKKDVLDQKECYIMDCICEIYVWCGKDSPIKARKQSLDVAIKLMTSRTEFWVAPIVRELPGGESVLFREKFSDWGYGPPIQMQKVAVGKNVAGKAEVEKIDVVKLFQTHLERQEVMVDSTGNGQVHVWRIVDFKKTPVDPTTYGQFYAGDTYIILYKYKVGNREAFLVYYWQGRTASINEKGTSALLTIELDKEFKANGTAKEVRVVQNQEPKHFLLVFKERGPYVVHSGKFIEHILQDGKPKSDLDTTALASKKGPTVAPKKETMLYELCGHSPAYSRLIQVDASKSAFKSNATFIMFTANRKETYLWQGAFAPDFAKDAAQAYVTNLALAYGAPETATLVKEGSEPSKFWNHLSDNEKSYPKWTTSLGQPRLFHASEATGQFKVNEIPPPFSRDDLTRHDCFILDAWDRVYMWQQKANPSETKQSLETALAYYELIKAERSLTPTAKSQPFGPVIMVKAAEEPLVFTSWFMAWSPVPAANLDSNLLSGSEYLSKFSVKYTYEDLVQKRYPPGIDTTRLEDLLDDDEFEKAFDMDRAAFTALPGWQAQKIKRAKGLF